MVFCKKCSAFLRTIMTTHKICLSQSPCNKIQFHSSQKLLFPGKHKKEVDIYANPADKLNDFLEVPLFQSDDVFRPSLEEMKLGRNFFYPDKEKEIKFLKSVIEMDSLPSYDLPEVAVIGRSNVGKSSLLQAMFPTANEHFVRVSKRPGHTRMMNFFQIGNLLTLVDMPGYGFNMPGHFTESVEQYLQTRKKLTRTFILVDGEVGITNNDKIGFQMLEEFQIPYSLIDGAAGMTVRDQEYFSKLKSFEIPHCLVLTKIDKASSHKLLKTVMAVIKHIKENTFCCHSQPFLTSSHTGEGIPLLQTFIAYLSGNLKIEGL